MVSVITVNYNGIADTRIFLDSFRKWVVNTDYEMIVVDNASTDNEAEILSQEYDWIRTIRSDTNLGFAGGNNLGIDVAAGDLLLFINNDIIIGSDFLSPLVDRLQKEEKTGVVSPRIVYPDQSLYYGGCKSINKYLTRIKYITGKDTTESGTATETALAHGACMMVKRDVIDKAGKWPEMYFLYSEELDWCLSIKDYGYKIWYEPQSLVCHTGSRSTGADSPLKYYYNTRNRFLLYKRHLIGQIWMEAFLYELGIAVPKRCITLVLSKKRKLIVPVLYGVIDALSNKFGKRRY